MHAARFIVVLTALVLAACGRGPDEARLAVEIDSRLTREFAPGLFTIRDISRMGTTPAQANGGGIYAYYHAALEFRKDYNLTSWKGLNLGTLAAVLGANPGGIDGFRPSGNRGGDVLRVNGRLDYRKEDGRWESRPYQPPVVDPKAEAPKALTGSGPVSVLGAVRELVGPHPTARQDTRDGIIIEELRQSVARIDLRLAHLDGMLCLGSGWPSGTYYRFGEAFTRYAKEQGFAVFNYTSEGSVENGISLQSGHLNFALLQSDVAEVLYKGWVKLGQLPHTDLRAVASLWPEALHIVTLEGNGIQSFADLRGKRLAVGSTQSGTRFTAMRVWQSAGLSHRDVSRVRELSLGESVKALEGGDVDAIVITGAVPVPALQALGLRRDDVRLVPPDPSIVERLVGEYASYYAMTIPEKTYPGQQAPYPTLAFAALLLSNRQTSEKDVLSFLQLMVDGVDIISRDFFRAGFISQNTALLGVSIPLHPGALRFYAQVRKDP